jgi:hypothetical protein
LVGQAAAGRGAHGVRADDDDRRAPFVRDVDDARRRHNAGGGRKRRGYLQVLLAVQDAELRVREGELSKEGAGRGRTAPHGLPSRHHPHSLTGEKLGTSSSNGTAAVTPW